ncbi:MAG: class I SAM-dependent methyltransferase [bacterium]
MTADIQEILCCPVCKCSLTEELICTNCRRIYSLVDGIYVMIDPATSQKKWKWDPTIFTEEKMTKVTTEYNSYINEETKTAQKIWWDKMDMYLTDFHGVVVDIATGLGGLFEKLMKSNSNFSPIATDIDPNVLFWTTKRLQKMCVKELFGVATDAKYLAFKNNTADYITSCSGFSNIPHVELAFQEVYRILKKNGKLVFMHSFFDENSSSTTLAKQQCIGIFIEKNLKAVLKHVGFNNIRSEIVASATWAKNPMDILPMAGDRQYYAVVYAVK